MNNVKILLLEAVKYYIDVNIVDKYEFMSYINNNVIADPIFRDVSRHTFLREMNAQLDVNNRTWLDDAREWSRFDLLTKPHIPKL